MKHIEFVIDRLKAGELFFFAGSGISCGSNLPSAYSILKHTANAFLPANLSDQIKRDICEIQPEVFYESIIGMTRSYKCLGIWRSLYRKDQEEHGVRCVPNLSHLFIVEYSYKNRLPIITTNFDSMFEQASELLNIKCQIILPTEPYPKADADILFICKVHGSIQNDEGLYSPHALWTTMTEITKVNTEWIEYLQTLMLRKHLCFVGYSGKDIDLFPHIAEFPKKANAKQIIWINVFDGDHSDSASKSCGALRICKWPSDLFEKISNRVGVQVSSENNQGDKDTKSIEILLNVLERSLTEKKLLNDSEKKLLYCMLLAKLGRYREAYKYALELSNNKHLDLKGSNEHLLYFTIARLSHETSKYESCGKYAREVLSIMKKKGGYDLNAVIQAKCLISEAYRMSIPNDVYFGQKKRIGDYLYMAFVLVNFVFSLLWFKSVLYRRKLRFSDLVVESQHELIEHRIRLYALLQSIIGSPKRGWSNFVKTFMVKRWDDIRKMSYRTGYSAGIANAGKFKYRLIPSEETKTESSTIYLLTTSSTGSELVVRNEADQLMRIGKLEESRKKFIEYADMAKKSGNILNEIKGIIGFAYANSIEGNKPLLTDALKRRFSTLVDEVEGRRWKDHFAYVDRIFYEIENS